jgi:hypothetical protein
VVEIGDLKEMGRREYLNTLICMEEMCWILGDGVACTICCYRRDAPTFPAYPNILRDLYIKCEELSKLHNSSVARMLMLECSREILKLSIFTYSLIVFTQRQTGKVVTLHGTV